MNQPVSTASLTSSAREFIESVVALRPRIAAFDCDGTLWAGDSGSGFFFWELERGLLPESVAKWIDARYKDYKAGRVDEWTICGEMVTIHEGLDVSSLVEAAEQFFEEHFVSAIFPEMLELTSRLAESGCEIWAVSSTNEWVVRAGARRFGIPEGRVLAANVHCENGKATGRLHRVPTDEDKVTAIRECIAGRVDAVFGNSIHDAAMLEIAPHAFAINPTAELRGVAEAHGWRMYYPEGTARVARQAGRQVVFTKEKEHS
jgi:phosphoserine phosphatase